MTQMLWVFLCVNIKFTMITSYCSSSYLCQHLPPLICYTGLKELSYVKLGVFKNHRGFFSCLLFGNIFWIYLFIFRKLKYYSTTSLRSVLNPLHTYQSSLFSPTSPNLFPENQEPKCSKNKSFLGTRILALFSDNSGTYSYSHTWQQRLKHLLLQKPKILWKAKVSTNVW